MGFSIRLTEEEKMLADSYAKLHSMSLGEAFKRALFDRIEDEYDIEEVPDPLSLNPKNFEILKLINLFQSKGVLIKDIICPQCNE